MRVALLGDIHANLPALTRVLGHADRLGIRTFWNIGDFVGYGAFPNEVIAALRRLDVVSIAGNYDLKVLRFPHKQEKWQRKKHPLKYQAFQYAYETLTPENRAYLDSLPQQRRLEIAGRRVLLTHASPVSNEAYLTPATPLAYLRRLAATAGADLVIHGHSHRSYVRRVDSTWFINTGSVGRPDDGDPRAEYAVLEFDAGQVQVDHHRLSYDLPAAVAALQQLGLPDAFGEMLRQGRDLDSVLAGQAGSDSGEAPPL